MKSSELLAILIGSGLKGASALCIAEDLLNKHGDLQGLCRLTAKEIAKTKGIGPARAVQLRAAFALGIRLQMQRAKLQTMDTPLNVRDLLMDEMSSYPVECVKVIALDAKLRFLGMEEISKGTVDEAIAHMREIFKAAIVLSAKCFVLAHNHPSGDPSPSQADYNLTRRVREASSMMQIPIVDHIIIGRPTAENPDGYFSFREAGHI